MKEYFKLVRHKDGIYRCKNAFKDVLFLLFCIVLLSIASVLNIFGVHIEALDRLLGTQKGDYTKEQVEKILKKEKEDEK